MKKVGVGVLHTLHPHGYFRVGGLRNVPQAELVAVSDTRKSKASSWAKKFGIRNVVTDEELFQRDDVDVVIIESHHDIHLEHTLRAMESGKRVFVDKPMACSPTEARRVISAAKRAHQHMPMVGWWMRLQPAFAHANDLIKSDVLGEIGYFRFRHAGWYIMDGDWGLPSPVDTRRVVRTKAPGGSLFDLAGHGIDLARWYFGDLDVVNCALWTLYPELYPDTEDHVIIVLKSSNTSTVVEVDASCTMHSDFFDTRCEITGEKGSCLIDINRNPPMKIYHRDRKKWEVPSFGTGDKVYESFYPNIEIGRIDGEHIVDCVLNDKDSITTAVDDLFVQEKVAEGYARASRLQ